jgi:hypothetical protein
MFHTFNNTLTGQLYRTSLEIMFLELGSDVLRESHDLPTIDLLTTHSLVKATYLFLQQHHIILRHDIEIPIQGEND